jgi:DNA-binding transcriptional MocR family regulator
MIAPGDIYVLAGALAGGDARRSLRSLAADLGVDHTLVHRALKRAGDVGLYTPQNGHVHRPNFEELVVHAGRFVAPARLGEVVPGIPAAWAAEPLAARIASGPGELPPVWPDPRGRIRGQALAPLHAAAPDAAARAPRLAHMLVLLDALRAGDTRVRSVAAGLLHDMLRAAS